MKGIFLTVILAAFLVGCADEEPVASKYKKEVAAADQEPIVQDPPIVKPPTGTPSTGDAANGAKLLAAGGCAGCHESGSTAFPQFSKTSADKLPNKAAVAEHGGVKANFSGQPALDIQAALKAKYP